MLKAAADVTDEVRYSWRRPASLSGGVLSAKANRPDGAIIQTDFK